MSLRVLFLHGFMGSPHEGDFLQQWNSDIEIFAPQLRELSTAKNLEQLYSEVENFNPQLIYGYSMGGRLALDIISKLSLKELKYIVLESSALLNLSDEEAKKRVLQDEKRAQEIRTNFSTFIKNWYQLPLWGELSQDQRGQWSERRFEENNSYKDKLAQQISFLSPGNFLLPEPQNWPQSPRYFYFCGAQDGKYSSMINEFKSPIPQFKIEICPTGGHNLHLQAPDFIIGNLKKTITP